MKNQDRPPDIVINSQAVILAISNMLAEQGVHGAFDFHATCDSAGITVRLWKAKTPEQLEVEALNKLASLPSGPPPKKSSALRRLLVKVVGYGALLTLVTHAAAQTKLITDQTKTCLNWKQEGTRPLLSQAVSYHAEGPDLTVNIPGYSEFVVRIVKSGQDWPDTTEYGPISMGGAGTSTLIIELTDTGIKVSVTSFGEVAVISGPAIVKPPESGGYQEECSGTGYILHESGKPPLTIEHPRWPELHVHACGFTWALHGDKATRVQACIHGVPVIIPNPVHRTFTSDVYKNAERFEACDWGGVCPWPRWHWRQDKWGKWYKEDAP